MIDFEAMPINYGLNYAFDCNAYESGAVWTGYQGQEMILSDTVSKYLDGSVLFPSGKGYGYWINSAADYKDSTKYIICKATETSTSNSYNWIFSERAGSYLYTTDICAYKDGRITLYANQNTPYTDTLATDYHVIAVSKSGTTATIYVDGVQKGQATNVASFTPTNYGINTASNTNAIPSSSTQNLFVKCAVHCKAAHSAYEIKTNSQWLLIQYGLAPEPLNSQMSGADAAVIAWVMAHNTEQSSSVAIQKKMYRKGIKQGADLGGDVTEKITEPLGDEGFNVLDENGPIIDMTKGVYILTDETTIDGVTGIFQLHVYLDGYSETIGQDTNTNRVVVELTGNGINETYTFPGPYWEGTTGDNAYYMTQATINKGYPGITGVYYWEYGESYYNRNWQFSGNYAIALQAGSTISTVSLI